MNKRKEKLVKKLYDMVENIVNEFSKEELYDFSDYMLETGHMIQAYIELSDIENHIKQEIIKD